jgi:hypothetical protein
MFALFRKWHKISAVRGCEFIISEINGPNNARGRAGSPNHDKQHCYHHAPTVKPEAATAVVELLTMGVRTPETC